MECEDGSGSSLNGCLKEGQLSGYSSVRRKITVLWRKLGEMDRVCLGY